MTSVGIDESSLLDGRNAKPASFSPGVLQFSNVPASTGEVDADGAWVSLVNLINDYLASPLSLKLPQVSWLIERVSPLREDGLVDVLRAYVLQVLDGVVRDVVAPRFWALLDPSTEAQAESHNTLQQVEGDRSNVVDKPNFKDWNEADPPLVRRRAYCRVKKALLYVDEVVNGHLKFIRPLDIAIGCTSKMTISGEAASGRYRLEEAGRVAAGVSGSIEERYRCAFTAQMMTGATSDFHRTMRAFFDRNLLFWHRSWVNESRRGQSEGHERPQQDHTDSPGTGDIATGRKTAVRDAMDVVPDGDEQAEETDAVSSETTLAAAVVTEDSDKLSHDTSVERALHDGEDGKEEEKVGGGNGKDEEQGEEEEEDEVEEEHEGEDEEEDDDDEDDRDGSDEDFSDMTRKELMELWRVLLRLGWFILLQDTFAGIMFSHILGHVKRRCAGVYDTPVLGRVIAWKNQVLLRWIALLLPAEGSDSELGNGASGEERVAQSTATSAPYGWAQRLGLAVHEAFCSARIAELFEIIADYPDSAVAVAELKEALQVTQQHQRLAALLRESVQKRLLHPGANTHQIIDVYIATIKVLRVLDPKDVLLETVAGPVRLYLQGRKDTVRCIVASLTDENSGDLYDELRRQDARPLDGDDGSDEDDDGPVAPNWEPVSRDADPSSGSRGGGDILSILVSIYGSKELFVTEYRMMLADKLVNNLSYDTDREVQNLELLKLRFGESSMHHCEIMVRDLEESKRVNANVHDRLGGRFTAEEQKEDLKCLDAIMVSQHFWPQLQGEDLKLHPIMEERLGEFSKAYSVIKNPRLLVWKKQLGVVQLTLEIGGVERDFSVSPVHATLILHFEGKNEAWSLSALAEEVGLAADVVQKKMMLWVNQGIVAEVPGPGYRLVKDQVKGGAEGVSALPMEESTEAAVSSDANDAEADKVIEQYLMGMLTNLGKLPINRIHNTLKMFMSGGDSKYDKTIQELAQLLWRLCSAGKLEQVDAEYRIAK